MLGSTCKANPVNSSMIWGNAAIRMGVMHSEEMGFDLRLMVKRGIVGWLGMSFNFY